MVLYGVAAIHGNDKRHRAGMPSALEFDVDTPILKWADPAARAF